LVPRRLLAVTSTAAFEDARYGSAKRQGMPFMFKPMLTSLIVPVILAVMAGNIVPEKRLRRAGRPVGAEGIG
jgi:hypothetical protein